MCALDSSPEQRPMKVRMIDLIAHSRGTLRNVKHVRIGQKQ
jgi:hypothetical protein